ncbi:MAG: hypothetical protein WD969_10320 [Paracoccaceae bacterium]
MPVALVNMRNNPHAQLHRVWFSRQRAEAGARHAQEKRGRSARFLAHDDEFGVLDLAKGRLLADRPAAIVAAERGVARCNTQALTG